MVVVGSVLTPSMVSVIRRKHSPIFFYEFFQYDSFFFPFHFFSIWHQFHSCVVMRQILFRNGYQIHLLPFSSFMYLDIFVIFFSCVVVASYCLFLETEIRGSLSALFNSLGLLSALGFKSFLFFFCLQKIETSAPTLLCQNSLNHCFLCMVKLKRSLLMLNNVTWSI